MRIISGNFKGKNILAPANLPVRPTTDFAKTGLFNILQNEIDFENTEVADLFCGTGSITYEFVSRGAMSTVSVDSNFNCVSFIKSTLEKLKAQRSKVIKSDAIYFLKKCTKKFDIVFADAPFGFEGIYEIPSIVFEKKLLKENGQLIIEHQSKEKIQSEYQPFKVKAYGNCAFSFFKMPDGW